MKWISSYFNQKWISLLLWKTSSNSSEKDILFFFWHVFGPWALKLLLDLDLKTFSSIELGALLPLGDYSTTHSLRSNLTFFSFISSVGSSLREVDFSQQVGLEVGSIFKSLFLCFIMRRDLLLMGACCCCFKANLDFKKVQFEERVLNPHAIFTVLDKNSQNFFMARLSN